MLESLSALLAYTWIVRALIVGLLVSLCASLLGVNLVLKRYSMIGDGLSHVGFGAMAIAMALNTYQLYVSIPIVCLSAYLLLRISENSRIKGDAAIAIISTTALSVGVIIIGLTSGMNTDVTNFMFGSILSMTKSDLIISVCLCALVLALYVVCYNKIFAVTFDETFARATGVRVRLYNILLSLLTAITIVLGMRMMGSLLISSLIIFPALTAMRVFRRFRSVIIASAVISVTCFVIGMSVSYLLSTAAGASVVAVNAVMFGLFSAVGFLRSRLKKQA